MSRRARAATQCWPPPWCQTPSPPFKFGSFWFIVCTNHTCHLQGRQAVGLLAEHPLPVPFPSRTGAVSWSPASGAGPELAVNEPVALLPPLGLTTNLAPASAGPRPGRRVQSGRHRHFSERCRGGCSPTGSPRAWRALPRCCPGGPCLGNRCPLGCRTEVPVASVSLAVKWERGFPKVLWASVYNVCCFLLRPPANQDRRSSAGLAGLTQRPGAGSGLCARPGPRGGGGQLAVVHRCGGANWRSGGQCPSLGGPGRPHLSFLCNPLFLCWCPGPKG